ncbi:MAG: sulfatase [Planctomycetota bacterium]
MSRPNILYLHSHDAGRYVQPYGHAIDTPNVQRLAEEGVLFRRAFCANPTCSPSRASLVTGQWPHQAGMFGLAGRRGWTLSRPEHHIANVLRERAGYTSALAGIQHVLRRGDELPYDRRMDSWGAGGGVEFLLDAPDEPFFLSVGLSDPHRMGRGFSPPPSYATKTDPRYVRPPDPIPDTPETRRDMADYIDAVQVMDLHMGQVLEALDRSGLADNTLVICTTDHGIAFPDMKCNLTDHGLGVMLILRGPRGFAGGKVVDGMVSHVDVYPTICEVAGIDRPEWLVGESMLPLATGAESIREETFAEINFHASYEPQRAIRGERWKYIRHFDANRGRRMANCDESLSKDLWKAHGWSHAVELPEHRLYDLVFDPHERNNLADDPAHADVLADMQARLERWMRHTDDPLLQGGISVPKGLKIVVNPIDASNPRDPTETWTGSE